MKTWSSVSILVGLSLSAAFPVRASSDFYSETVALRGIWNGANISDGKSWSDTVADPAQGAPVALSVQDGWHHTTQVGSAYAGVGTLKAYSYASVFTRLATPDGGVSAEAVTEARSDNVLTINSPGLTGKVGWLSFSAVMSGLIHNELYWHGNDPPTGNNNVRLAITANGQPALVVSTGVDFATGGIVSSQCKWDSGNAVCQDYSLGTTYVPMTVRVPFVYGAPITIDERLSTSTRGQTQWNVGYFNAYADVSHSAYWGGIQDVTYNSQSVGYSISSDSALDWMHNYAPAAVPEPASMLLMLGGLGLLGGRVRRSRS